MQPFSVLGLELFQCSKADLKMLADAVAVEVSGHAGQFDLAMQRLVRYAKQGSVRYAEAEPLGGHRSPFHVEGDGTRLRQAPDGRYGGNELPIPGVRAGY